LAGKLYNKVVIGFDYLILVEVMDCTKYNQMKESQNKGSAAEIAHQLESAEERNKRIVKKAVLDAGLQEYDTFVRPLF
jgi:hypothetical protein